MSSDNQPTAPQLSALAIVSLVCAILWGCGFLSLIGLILGIIALIRIGNSHGRLTGRGLALAGIIVSIVCLLGTLVLAGLLLPALHRARGAARKVHCSSNLKQLGLAIEMYSADSYYGCMPQNLEQLTLGDNSLIMDPDVFICPGAPEPDPNSTAFRSDFILLPCKRDDRSDKIIVVEKAGHHDDGGNVLYKDIHTKFVRTGSTEAYAAFVKALRSGNRAVIQKYAPECSNGRPKSAEKPLSR